MNAGCAGKTMRSLENVCHTWAPYRCVHDEALYKSTFTFTFTFTSHRHWWKMSAAVGWQAEIERLQSELDAASHQHQTSVSSSVQLENRDTASSDMGRPTADVTASNESQQLIDTLKCQLQQAALVQQTSNLQLDAVKQVFTSCFVLEMCGNCLQHSHSLPFPSPSFPFPIPFPRCLRFNFHSRPVTRIYSRPIPIPVWLINNIYHWIIKRW